MGNDEPTREVVVKNFMKHIALLLLLFSCSTNKNVLNYPKDNSPFEFGYDNKAYVSCNIEEVIWKDSTKVNFLAISIKGLVEIQNDEYYSWYSGPIKVWNRTKNCYITSVFTKEHTGYFLMDDFKRQADSLIITISGRHGEQNKSMSYQHIKTLQIHKKDLHLDSLLSIPLNNYADRNWYTDWKNGNPEYQNERMREIENECN